MIEMERIKSINPSRIAWCCVDHGITMAQLAAECGIATASMDREDALTFNQLRSIAKYFGRGILFFLESDPVDDEQVHTPNFARLLIRSLNYPQSLKPL